MVMMLKLVIVSILLATVSAISDSDAINALLEFQEFAQTNPVQAAHMLANSHLSAKVPMLSFSDVPHAPTQAGRLPIVFAHGMGDSCFNGGMQDITNQTGAHQGVYAVCIPTGANQMEGTSQVYIT
jgi:hypothetical protein